ncbi:MAG: Solanesyl diphosphate synthase, partial [uncultured Nocardioidaceae bacterium]
DRALRLTRARRVGAGAARPRPGARGAAARPDDRGGGPAGGRDPVRGGLHHRGVPPPHARRRQAVPAAARPAGRGARHRGRRPRGRAHRRLRRGADPPRLALPRRRHGRGGAAAGSGLGQRPVGQPRRDPGGGLAVLEVLGAHRTARTGGGADPGRDLHPARRGAGPRDAAAGGGPGPPRLPPARRGRQDRVAHRDVRPLRRDVRRHLAGDGRGAHGVRRADRDRLPALRRHPRRRQRRHGVRQDAGDRPARGRPDAAGDARDPLGPTRGRAAARAAPRSAHRRRPPRRGAGAAAGAPGDGRGARARPGADRRGRRHPRRGPGGAGEGRPRRVRRAHRRPHLL